MLLDNVLEREAVTWEDMIMKWVGGWFPKYNYTLKSINKHINKH